MNKTQVKLKYAIGDATCEDAIRKTGKDCPGSAQVPSTGGRDPHGMTSRSMARGHQACALGG